MPFSLFSYLVLFSYYFLSLLSLLQGIFPTQGPNPGLPHCRGILYQLSHQGYLPSAEPNWTISPVLSHLYGFIYLFCSLSNALSMT